MESCVSLHKWLEPGTINRTSFHPPTEGVPTPSYLPLGAMKAALSVRRTSIVALIVSTCFLGCSGDDNPVNGGDDEAEFNFNQDLIAFRSDRDGQDEIYLVTTDGEETINITNHPADDTDPAWSPDGQKIAFASNRDGDYDIYIMDVDGSNVTKVTDISGKTNDNASDKHPSWCAGGSKIVFQSNRGGGNSDIYAMDPDGSNVRQITTDPASDLEPSCAKDCPQIVFYTARSGNGDVMVTDIDASDFFNFGLESAFDCSPSLVPDCVRATIVSDRGGESDDIWIMNLDGSDAEPLVAGPGNEFNSSWSDDGSNIAYDSDENGNSDIYSMDADGGEPTQLTDSPGDDDLPVWRP